MKFFIFNVAVIVALVTLFSGETLPSRETFVTKVSGMTEAVSALVAEPSKDAQPFVGKTFTAPELPPAQSVAVIEPKPVPETQPEQKASALVPETSGEPLDQQDPNVSAMPSEPTHPTVAASQVHDSQYMTHRERRRELQRLARDMEDLFLDRSAQ